MTCLKCQHWNLRDRREMSRQGLGLCNIGPRWEYKPPQHSCNERKPEDEAKVLKRIDWLRKVARIENE